MLNIGRLVTASSDYYLNKVARSQEEYYTGTGEAPGVWLGSQAGRLGLAGTVPEEGLRRLLAGAHPATGVPLAERAGARTVAGFDLTFRAPKSVSLLYALGAPDVAQAVNAAHDSALAQALGYLERQATWTRRGHAGRDRVRGGGLLAAGYQHRTSRAGDPLLHTHVLVANTTQGPDGRWTTLDSRSLYRHAKTASHLYQAALRHELTRTLGVAWQPPVRGHADLVGVPRRVIEAFSTRRRQILAHLAARGQPPTARAAQVATLATRPAKPAHLPEATLRDRWHAQAERLGFDAHQLADVLHAVGAHDGRRHAWARIGMRRREHPRPAPPPRLPAGPDVDQLAAELAGPAGLTASASTFTRRDVIQAVCERLPAGAPAAAVEASADQLLTRPGLFVPLSPTSHDSHERHWTTPELLDLEAASLADATARRAAGVGVVPEPIVTATSALFGLDDDQAAMLRRLTTAGAGVEVVNAAAGTGKTRTLDACRHAWQHAGYQVHGAALAAAAAHKLGTAAHLDDAATIARLLGRLDRAGGLAPRSVLLVDEAGMVGTRTLARLLRHAQAASAKLVLVGDVEQLPEIDAGGAFAALARRLDAAELTRNRRQAHPWERDALEALRAGDVEAALAAYQAHGRISVSPTEDAARARLVADWWHAHQHPDPAPEPEPPPEPVMLAATRAQVADLNDRARGYLARTGRLGAEELDLDGRGFAVGDRVVCLRNDYRLDVLNNTRATVTTLHPAGAGAALTIRTDDGRDVHLPAGYLLGPDGPQLAHAYAVTGHKAQGMTGGRVFILAGEGLYRQWAYTALSRGRLDNRLYLAETTAHDVDLDQPAQPARHPGAYLARALADSRAQTLAIDQADGVGIEL